MSYLAGVGMGIWALLVDWAELTCNGHVKKAMIAAEWATWPAVHEVTEISAMLQQTQLAV